MTNRVLGEEETFGSVVVLHSEDVLLLGVVTRDAALCRAQVNGPVTRQLVVLLKHPPIYLTPLTMTPTMSCPNGEQSAGKISRELQKSEAHLTIKKFERASSQERRKILKD